MNEYINLIDKFTSDSAQRRILCIGEVMLDRFLYGNVERISPEAPVPVFHVQKKNRMLGGSGNVVRNLTDLNGYVHFISTVGADDSGRIIKEFLAADAKVTFDLIETPDRPTTLKTRYIADHQQMLRVDEEETIDLQTNVLDQIWNAYVKHVSDCTVVIMSDYGKGMFSKDFNHKLIAHARKLGKTVIVDPKSNDFKDYGGATLITPNFKEFNGALRGIDGLTPTQSVEENALALKAYADLDALLVTRGKDGMTLLDGQNQFHHLPTQALEVFDVSGAGDTVIATLSLAIAHGASYPQAMYLANQAAGIVVGKLGTATTNPQELKKAIHQIDAIRRSSVESFVPTWDHALKTVQNWQKQGLSVGFTNGCYDILHPGHLSLLEDARSRCDRLVVGLNSDASVHRLKGPTRPINSEDDRGTLLAGLGAVDLVVIFDEQTPLELINHLRPNLLVKGADYTVEQVIGAKEVLSWGGDVYLSPLVPGKSTSNIADKLMGGK